MQVQITIPKGSNVALLLREYPDAYEDSYPEDDCLTFWIGDSSDCPDDEREKGDNGEDLAEWMSHDEAGACCGWVNGAFGGDYTLIEGNGGWAQGMISQTDFSRLAISDADKAEYKQTSDLYWAAHARGQAARQNPATAALVAAP